MHEEWRAGCKAELEPLCCRCTELEAKKPYAELECMDTLERGVTVETQAVDGSGQPCAGIHATRPFAGLRAAKALGLLPCLPRLGVQAKRGEDVGAAGVKLRVAGL